jgi:hypothetical protein
VIRPDIERYKTQVQEYQHHNTKQTKKLIVYGDYLHEQLMHIIAQLDTMPHVNEQERNERKQSVKDTQCLLDQLEQIKCDLTRLLE